MSHLSQPKCYWIILTLRPTRPTDEMNEIYPQSKIVLLKELTHKASKPFICCVFIWLIILPVIVRPIPNMRYLHLKLDCRMDMSCDKPWRIEATIMVAKI